MPPCAEQACNFSLNLKLREWGGLDVYLVNG